MKTGDKMTIRSANERGQIVSFWRQGMLRPEHGIITSTRATVTRGMVHVLYFGESTAKASLISDLRFGRCYDLKLWE